LLAESSVIPCWLDGHQSIGRLAARPIDLEYPRFSASTPDFLSFSRKTHMRNMTYRTLIIASVLCQSIAFCAFSNAGSAETLPVQQVAPSGADDADADSGQIALTDKQVQNLLAAQKTIISIVAKIPEDQADAPNPQIQAELDKTAKRYGFKDYGEYDDVANNITFILEGFDQKKKTFVGHDVIVKRQIDAVQADDTLSPKEKRAQIRDLKETLRSIDPVQYPDNITLIAKYYDKLSEIFDDDVDDDE
jgi:hypothetical protein